MDIPEKKLIDIDGSYGEGGGQILRTALALSAILSEPFTLRHIRSKRKNPGLQAQHLKAVEALATITRAQTEGVKIGSPSILFVPKEIVPGEFKFDIATAGSVTLLLQALFLPLCFSQKSSKLILVGGTHVPWSPPFHYLSEVLFPTLESMGIQVEATLERLGWYPQGGGLIQVRLDPVDELKPISLVNRGHLKRIRGLSGVSNLPKHIAERQRDYAVKRIEKEMKTNAEITVLHDVPARGPGSFLFLLAETERAMAGFSSLGKRGKPAEEVGREAVDALEDYIESEGCIDPHLADQLVPFMALAKGNSSFTTSRITEHLLTNLWVVQHFLNVTVLREGEKGEKGRVEFFNK